jgi:murein DD-endopeptidase MepM/ murein hydrolase activator NlpD
VLVGVAVATIAVLLPGPTSRAVAADTLIEIQQDRQDLQDRLQELHRRTVDLEAEASDAAGRLAELRARAAEQHAYSQQANAELARDVRASYKRGSLASNLSLLAAGAPDEAVEQATFVAVLAQRSREHLERALAAQRRTDATAAEAERTSAQLRARRAELDAAYQQTAGLLVDVEQREQALQAALAAEQAAARRTGRQSRVSARASRSATRSERAPPSASGLACPVGAPRSYSDTYGARRSGGRRHLGTDILAPRGTAIFAIEAGTVMRLSGNHLGGISLYLAGDSGATYYYTHLDGYVDGLATGMHVETGEQVAYNGDTGNARGIPHLHIEVLPGGGANVNPYPYVLRACG